MTTFKILHPVNFVIRSKNAFKIQNLRSLRVTSHLVPPEPRSAEEDHHPKKPVILSKKCFMNRKISCFQKLTPIVRLIEKPASINSQQPEYQ